MLSLLTMLKIINDIIKITNNAISDIKNFLGIFIPSFGLVFTLSKTKDAISAIRKIQNCKEDTIFPAFEVLSFNRMIWFVKRDKDDKKAKIIPANNSKFFLYFISLPN